MSEFPIINPLLGVFLALAGLALAVILGLALYKDENQEKASATEPLKLHKEGSSV